jgi:hypothetical protein
VCGKMSGIASADTTIAEMIIKSFGLTEIILSIIQRGLTSVYICFPYLDDLVPTRI